MGWAGPICTRTLADLGADVIKIEATQYPDWWRGVDRRPAYVLEQMYEKSVRYCIMNRNKRGITLDLTRPQGLDLAKRLVADADVVVDNYSAEVLPKLGLGHEVLSKLNPKLVMMSMSAFGAGSVHRDCRAYGSTLEQGSGLPSVVALALLKRPGTAVLAGVIAGLVGAAFAPWWIGRFVGTGLLVGALIELPFLITRYTRWDAWMFYASAAFAGLVLAIAVFIGLGAEHYAWWAWAIALPLWVASPVLFTWVGRVIATRLAKAGVAQSA